MKKDCYWNFNSKIAKGDIQYKSHSYIWRETLKTYQCWPTTLSKLNVLAPTDCFWVWHLYLKALVFTVISFKTKEMGSCRKKMWWHLLPLPQSLPHSAHGTSEDTLSFRRVQINRFNLSGLVDWGETCLRPQSWHSQQRWWCTFDNLLVVRTCCVNLTWQWSWCRC